MHIDAMIIVKIKVSKTITIGRGYFGNKGNPNNRNITTGKMNIQKGGVLLLFEYGRFLLNII